MQVNLLSDYRGVLTDETFYLAGVHDLPDGQGAALVDAGRAELVYEYLGTVYKAEPEVEKKKPVTVAKKPARRASRKRAPAKKK